MTRRQTVFFAGLATISLTAAVTLASGPATALTIENYSGASGSGTGSGWVDLNYNDPNKKPARDGDKRTLNDNGPRVFFGPTGSANQGFNPGQYFTPNYLMGK